MATARILQLTDLHVFAEADTRLKGIPTRELLQDVVNHICEHEPPFDLVVVTGDHTHDELPASYDAVRNILQPFLNTLRQLPGNHDDRRILREVFSDRIAGSDADSITFSVPCGDWHCIGLDSHIHGDVAGEVSADQLDWLKTQLHDVASDAIALFMHHPPVEVGSVWMDRIGLNNRERMQEVIVSDPRIRLVVCGHVHHAFSTHLGAALVVTTPSTGIQFSPAGEEATFVAGPPGYRVIELDGDTYLSRVSYLPETRFTPK